MAPSAALDPNRPSIARTYDYLLGGKQHYHADRALADRLRTLFPRPEQLARINRDFVIRATRFLARDVGITQFLDCGSGLPSAGLNVHEVVQHWQRSDASVVYVDHDPVVAAYGRALTDDWRGRVRFAEADFLDVDKLLSHETVAGFDWNEPIAVLHCATLHHVTNDALAHAAMSNLVDRLPPGSVVMLSHLVNPGGEWGDAARAIEREAAAGGADIAFREVDVVAGLFDPDQPRSFFEPGVVPVSRWWPAGPSEIVEPWDHLMYGGIARV